MSYLALGGAGEVGASCALLQLGPWRLLIDAGIRHLSRSETGRSALPDLAQLRGQPPHAILLSHAHTDHVGALAVVSDMFSAAPIFTTRVSAVLGTMLLADGLRIAVRRGDVGHATLAQVRGMLERVYPIEAGTPFAPIPGAPITVTPLHAGHIPGALMFFISTPQHRILVTNDISGEQRLVAGLSLAELPRADLVIVEGTYGTNLHPNRAEEEHRLLEDVGAVLAQGGKVLFPAFAIGRAQEVLLILRDGMRRGLLRQAPIFLDGMVKEVCQILPDFPENLHPDLAAMIADGEAVFADAEGRVRLVTSSGDRVSILRDSSPAIFIASSGMLVGGPSLYYAEQLAGDPRNAIFFSGYLDDEAPGKALLNASQGDTLTVGGKQLRLNCSVQRYRLSAHVDGREIVRVVDGCGAREIVLVHGEPSALEGLAGWLSPFGAVHVAAVGTPITWQEGARR